MTNKMQLHRFINLFLVSSTCFGWYLRPSSGARDYIYSFWYCSSMSLLGGVMDEMELMSSIIRSTWLYLQLLVLLTDVAAGWCHGWDGTHKFHHKEHMPVFTASGIVHQCCCRFVSWMRWNSRVPSHPWCQPAATSVNNTRSCKYSHVLLMMGEDIAQNM